MISRSSRRTFLRVLALGSGASLLVACGQPPAAAPAKPAEPAKPAAPAATAKPAAPAAAAKPAEAPKPAAAAPPASPVAAKPAEAAKPAAAQAAPAAKTGVVPAGKLTIAQGIDPRSLWPNSSTTQQEINVSEQITEKLFEFTPNGDGFDPRLATEWKQIDDTTLQLKLRQGVTFTNGEPFNAESAKMSVEVVLKSPSYSAFSNVMAGAEIVDQYTLNIKTKSPTLLHMPALAQGSFQYPAKYFQEVGEEGFGKKPIGTGPYVFGEWVKDSAVTLEANTGYWNGAPAVKNMIFRNIPEGAAKLAALEAGEIDFAIDVPLDAVERLERNPDLSLASRTSSRAYYLAPSTLTDTPLKNPKVRQALFHAVDVQALIKGLFKGRAKQLAQVQQVTPGSFGYDEKRTVHPYDPDKAKAMLAEAGYPNGFEFTFKYSSGRYAQDKEMGQAIASQLAKVGIKANQEVLESGTFLTQLSQLKLENMRLAGSLPPPDAHFTFQTYQTGFRYSYYSNKEVDELVNKGASTANVQERLDAYKKILDIFEQDPPYVALFLPDDFYGLTKKVKGFTPYASQFIDTRMLSLG